MNILKAARDRSKAALERAKSNSSHTIRLDPALLEQFGPTMRGHFATGSIPFRKAYLQSLISVVEVDDAQIFAVVRQQASRPAFSWNMEWDSGTVLSSTHDMAVHQRRSCAATTRRRLHNALESRGGAATHCYARWQITEKGRIAAAVTCLKSPSCNKWLAA